MQKGMGPGDGLVLFGMCLWLTISVGPWYIGVILLLLGTLLNYISTE